MDRKAIKLSKLMHIITSKTLEPGTCNVETIFTSPCVSHVTCNVTYVINRISLVPCHVSSIFFFKLAVLVS